MFKFGRDFWRSSWAIPLLKARPPTANCPALSLASSEHLKGCSSSPYFVSFSVKISWEKPAKALLKEITYKQYLLPSPSLPNHPVHCRHFSSWSSMIPPCDVCADYSWWWSCPLCTKKWLPGNTAPSPSQEACSSWVLIFEDQSNIRFPVVFSTSPSHQDRSKTIKSGLTVTRAIALSTRRCIPAGPVDLCMFSLLKVFPDLFLFHHEHIFLASDFPLISRARDS